MDSKAKPDTKKTVKELENDKKEPEKDKKGEKNASQASLVGKTQMLHIDIFDAKKFHVINSPRSLASMKELGIQQEDLKLKTEEDLKGMFNLNDPKEKEAFKKCVEMHQKAHKNLIKKISERRKEMIKVNDEAMKKKKEHDALKSKQLKHLEEEKKLILKQLELEQKKKEEAEKKKKAEQEREAKKSGKDEGKDSSPKPKEKADKPKEKDPAKDKSDPTKPTTAKELPTKKDDLKKDDSKARVGSSMDGKQAREKSAVTHKSENEKKLILNEELKESSILVFLDQSAHHKNLLDVDLKERTELDLKKDIKRMRELMKKQKKEVIEMTQKPSQALSYKSHEALGNAKTRKIEYLYDLSKDPVKMMKEKQQKEMEHMMNFELALQVIEHEPGNQKTERRLYVDQARSNGGRAELQRCGLRVQQEDFG